MDAHYDITTEFVDVLEPSSEVFIISSDSEDEALEVKGFNLLSPSEGIERKTSIRSSRKRTKKQKVESVSKKTKIVYECSVCLCNIRAKKIAKPSGCNHYFCVACLQKWSKNKNSCPLDRLEFSHADILDRETLKVIAKLDRSGKIIDLKKNVECNECHECSICNSSEMKNTLIACDGCFLKYHIGCLLKPEMVHAGPWLCQICEPLGFENVNIALARSKALQKHHAITCYRSMQANTSRNLEMVNHIQRRNTPGSLNLNPQNASLVTEARSEFNVPPQNANERQTEIPAVVNPGETPDVVGRLLLQQSDCYGSVFRNGIVPLLGSLLPVQPSTSSTDREFKPPTVWEIERLARQFLKPSLVNKGITKEKYNNVLKKVVLTIRKETILCADRKWFFEHVRDTVKLCLDLL